MNSEMMSVNDNFLKSVSDLLAKSKNRVKTAINLTMVYTYFEIGKMIVEEEQKGRDRAKYGKYLIRELSNHLTARFGKGFSESNLKAIRRFYIVYSEGTIGQTVFAQFKDRPSTSTGRKFYLSWSHYLKLMRIEDIAERNFYEIESIQNNWSLSELNR